MSDAALLIDFGSTYTKLRAVDLGSGHILASGQGPSTVTTDVNDGLDAALADLGQKLGGLPSFKHRLASSSAAGGLTMVTVGLVEKLTAEAARLAALGAGAKLIDARAYKLSPNDAEAIKNAKPDILLLAGGTNGGNEETILWNAKKLADVGLGCPVVVAGNRLCANQVADTLRAAGMDARISENVMPEFNLLNVEPARSAIRDVFIDRIVHAKGIDKAADRFDQVLMPTPAAVMEGARLLSEGTPSTPGVGPLIVIDIGGATTDVHSIADGAPTNPCIVQHGLPEPFAKRTVEGDLGMRHNARTVVELLGTGTFAEQYGLIPKDVENNLQQIDADVERLPSNLTEYAFDAALAETAIACAMDRHTGHIEITQTVSGPVTTQFGKDLSGVKAVIGTGGVLAHGGAPAAVLKAATAAADKQNSLRPKNPKLLIDNGYALYACGLLADVEPETALRLAHASLSRIGDLT